ncbi:MAG: N-acetyltransferase [Phycisphaeraceae bacterium]|nr:N-acetyltransferase [Phycisphaeraceae bacterium]MCW5754917.1 N-acetyltransferase [Phycisphaeraceae bacterium]
MHVRLAEERDLDDVTAIVNWAITCSTAHFGLTTTTTHTIVQEWRAQCDRYPWLIAEDAAGFLGFAKGGPFRGREAYDWTVELTVYVRPDKHGRGIGRALYARLLDMLRMQGFGLAVALVAVPNPASESLHRRIGLHELGRMPHAGYKLNTWLDVLIFGTRLNDLADPPAPTLPVSAVMPRFTWPARTMRDQA